MATRSGDPIAIIRALRAEGAVEVEVDGAKVRARFAGPPAGPAPEKQPDGPTAIQRARAMMVEASVSPETAADLAASLGLA